MADKQEKVQSHARRDQLLKIQAEAQARWAAERAFEADAPPPGAPPPPGGKYFGNFPYPYMNGMLHLGHAFTLTKVEFACAYHRLRGANVLFPFGFHCTGMPIKACADKLTREVEEFGNPPVFPVVDPEAAAEGEAAAAAAAAAAEPATQNGGEPAKFKGKKSKAAAKAGPAKYQWEIMQSLGIGDVEIAKFRDPAHWLKFFPPIAIDDLKSLGLGVDWRRSFITTDYNPFYDSFVRWQMNTLYKAGKIVMDCRYTIYSPLDGQPCADHDRASGEGALPQEYTLIKMEVIPPFTGKLEVLAGRRVFLAAATLRPETMYGQTNAWVKPDGAYGAYEVNERDVFVVTLRAALNMAYQTLSRVAGKPSCLVELVGQDLIGLPLRSPKSPHAAIYALPMLTILTDKGTGVVTSVPSDSPDDYMALQDLKAKPQLRAKFGVKDEWVLPFEVVHIVDIPGFEGPAAPAVCRQLKISSQNDGVKLAEAKKLTYLKGFTDGVLAAGEFKGQKVSDAKPHIKKMLVDSGEAVLYSEPDKRVVSRSGDDCVVALTDQWYLTYGEGEWKAQAEECLAGMELYAEETRHGFEHTLGWLDRWACSRSFGLGTRIPWDPQFLVESLSDSTIYMAYYTVAHLLQRGDLFGADRGAADPGQLTDAVWDYFFQGGPPPTDTSLPPALLESARREFEYWYPFDLRASGKDLINNHLSFCIYSHTALFPKERWPRGMRCNGHLLLNSKKMSKSDGNFKTVRDAVEEFSADATRFALADAGDTVDDANFEEDRANSAILRLTRELTWMEELTAALREGALRGGALSFADRVFRNEIDIAVAAAEAAYAQMLFREALKTGYYDLQLARDEYRLAAGAAGMHRDLAARFMEVGTQLLTPICPHYAEHVWRHILNKPGLAIKGGWPAAGAPDMILKASNEFLQAVITNFRGLLTKLASGDKKGGAGKKAAAAPSEPAARPTTALVFVAPTYVGWKADCLKLLQEHYDQTQRTFRDADIKGRLLTLPIAQGKSKKEMGSIMSFVQFKKDAAMKNGPKELELKLPYGEYGVLHENVELIKRQLGLEEVSVHLVSDEAAVARAGPDSSRIASAEPGNPIAVFLSA